MNQKTIQDLSSAGQHQECLQACQKLLQSEPENPFAWKYAGKSLIALQQFERARQFLAKAHQIDKNDPETMKDIGNIYLNTKNKIIAIKWYKKALEANNLFAPAINNLANLKKQDGNHKAAIDLFKQSIEADPKLIQSYIGAAASFLELGELDQATSLAKKALKMNKDVQTINEILGVIFQKKNNIQQAIKYYQKELAINPRSSTSLLNIGLLHLQQGKAAEAIEPLSIASALVQTEQCSLLLAQAYQSLGDFNNAIIEYKKMNINKTRNKLIPFNLGLCLLETGRNSSAIEAFKVAVQLDESFIPAWGNIGTALMNEGRHQEARLVTQKVLEKDPDNPTAHMNLGSIYKAFGNLDQALASTLRSLELKPDNPTAHMNLGSIYKNLGKLEPALASTLKSLEIKPDNPDAHMNLGSIYKDLGKLEPALASTLKSLEIKPDNADAHMNLGSIQKDLGNLDLALASTLKSLELKPDNPDAHINLGGIYKKLGKLNQAVASTLKSLEIKPNNPVAHSNLGSIYQKLGELNLALASTRKSLELQPDNPDIHLNLGSIHKDLGNLDQALASIDKCLELKPNTPVAHLNLGSIYKDMGKADLAIACFERCCQTPDISPSETVAAITGRIACLMALDCYDESLLVADSCSDDRRLQLMTRLHVLPVLYATDHEVAAVRKRWEKDAVDLYKLLKGITQEDPAWEQLYVHAWTLTNFHLAYQMEDDRPLQELYSGIIDRILRPRLGAFMQPLPQRNPSNISPLRVGVISPNLMNHNGSIWALGWLEGMANHPGYEIFSYNLGTKEDSGSQRFAALGSYRHLPLRGENPEVMLQQILKDQLDLLIYTDIGMHPASNVTSVLQLASIQAQGWGHPISSGSKTIHYYFSGEGMEPEGNEDHYSETLYRLPKTGLNYNKPATIHDGQLLFDKFNLPRNRPILNSLQSTFKYLPRNDWTFAEIAQRHPEALIVLVSDKGNGSIAKRLYERLKPHFEHRDLNIENHLRILPRLDYGDYMGLFAISHHTIDTIDWNGGNSSMQSLSLDCPVVTLPASFMRGRHTVSMLEVLELPELIAKNVDDYIAISCRLLKEQSFYQDMRAAIKARKAWLFHDKSVAKAFQVAVDTICRKPLKRN
ncbi:TPR repeat-containing protein [Synechococcus sp. BIOS-U3-1]|uniref:tetratricopeptide repeat protein n=1 Tax=Synechococcus sp. BIOS-U3-1 TaxID=1400865 RepID=UPI0016463EBD|nr:tetratricopeptide repeat protein [Synechococcus sp. BIOS-U3-1]QNI59905.1 TPR repeat-containing protein [Synechococcus sp. BIOS-U3-1]